MVVWHGARFDGGIDMRQRTIAAKVAQYRADTGAPAREMSRLRLHLAAACLLAVCAVACAGNLSVTTIQTGRGLNSDNSVSALTTAFKPNDTIYVLVLTEGSGSATIGVKFSILGGVISEPEKKVLYRCPAATEFHIEYSGGFPAGDYDIEVTFNGQPAGMRKVRVES